MSVWSWFLEGMSAKDMVRTFSAHGWNYSELSSEHGRELMARGDAARIGAIIPVFDPESIALLGITADAREYRLTLVKAPVQTTWRAKLAKPHP